MDQNKKLEENTDSDNSSIEPSFLEEHGEKIWKKIVKPGVLFEHQKKALDEILTWFNDPKTVNTTAIISMPTGTGKTGVICCLPYFLGKHVAEKTLEGINLKKPILVIAPGLEILNQLEDNLFPRNLNTFIVKRGIVTKEKIGKYHYRVHVIKTNKDIAPDTFKLNELCLVNAQKGHKEVKPGKYELYTWSDLPIDSFSVVVVDEAHHLPAPMWKDIIDRFKSHAKVVFFTATPYRCDKKELTEDIDNTGLCYHMTRTEAIKKRIIRDTNPIALKKVQGERHTEAEAKQQLLSRIDEKLRQKNEVLRFPDDTEHMAILCAPSIVGAKQITVDWNQMFPSKAAYIHSGMKQTEQDQVMTNLRAGKIALIVIVQKLLEGFDHPPISVAAICTRIVSPVKFAQFIGRAQRIYRPDGKIEQDGIKADIISDPFFEQDENYEKFETEALIPDQDIPNED